VREDLRLVHRLLEFYVTLASWEDGDLLDFWGIKSTLRRQHWNSGAIRLLIGKLPRGLRISRCRVGEVHLDVLDNEIVADVFRALGDSARN